MREVQDVIGFDIENWLWAIARATVAGNTRVVDDTLVATAPVRNVADRRIVRRAQRTAQGALYVERRSHHRDPPSSLSSAGVREPGALPLEGESGRGPEETGTGDAALFESRGCRANASPTLGEASRLRELPG